MGQLIDSVFLMLLKARQKESSSGAEDQTGENAKSFGSENDSSEFPVANVKLY